MMGIHCYPRKYQRREYTNPKLQALNLKQIQMVKNQNIKRYDLEERTLKFAKESIYC